MPAGGEVDVMASEREELVRARVKLAGLEKTFSEFPEDVAIAIEQAEMYNKAIAELKASPRYRGVVVPGEASR
jgi:hypothetical protein